MSREWQQTKLKKYLMPEAVYYQSIWAVRDLGRMEERLEQLEISSENMVCERFDGIMQVDFGDRYRALEKEILSKRITDIYAALESVPIEYRFYILQNIVLRDSGKDYPKEWRNWKQKFLFRVAKNLSLM